MSATTTYIITGSNRGLGLGYLKILIERPNVVVYAGVRSIGSASQGELGQLAQTHNHLHIVQLASGSVEDVKNLVSRIGQAPESIVLIANAGISNNYTRADKVPLESIREHFEVNAMGPIVLFQGLATFLKEAKTAKFIAISTELGSIGLMKENPVSALSYGMSKAALNYGLAKIAQENPELIVVPIHPGWVQTDMGNRGAVDGGLEHAPLTLKESVDGTIAVIDGAKIEDSGKFVDYLGKSMPW